MKRKSVRLSVCMAVVLAMSSGCSSKLLRETVMANTETMIGLTVAQNSQTQVHEFKFGYARHELFIVPTDKFVKYKEKGGIRVPEEYYIAGATKTANVIGEIQVGGTSKDGNKSVDVYQRLAVGDIAVRSGAAIALLAQNAGTAKAAAEANKALGAGFAPRERAGAFSIIDSMWGWLVEREKAGDKRAADAMTKLDELVEYLPTNDQYDRYFYPGTSRGQPQVLTKETNDVSRTGFLQVKTYLSVLNLSIRNIDTALQRVKDKEKVLIDLDGDGSSSEADATDAVELSDVRSELRGVLETKLTALNNDPRFRNAFDMYLDAVLAR